MDTGSTDSVACPSEWRGVTDRIGERWSSFDSSCGLVVDDVEGPGRLRECSAYGCVTRAFTPPPPIVSPGESKGSTRLRGDHGWFLGR